MYMNASPHFPHAHTPGTMSSNGFPLSSNIKPPSNPGGTCSRSEPSGKDRVKPRSAVTGKWHARKQKQDRAPHTVLKVDLLQLDLMLERRHRGLCPPLHLLHAAYTCARDAYITVKGSHQYQTRGGGHTYHCKKCIKAPLCTMPCDCDCTPGVKGICVVFPRTKSPAPAGVRRSDVEFLAVAESPIVDTYAERAHGQAVREAALCLSATHVAYGEDLNHEPGATLTSSTHVTLPVSGSRLSSRLEIMGPNSSLYIPPTSAGRSHALGIT